MEIRPYEAIDLPAIAELHGRAFPSSTLAKLGPEAVARYLGCQLELDEVEALVVGPGGRPVAALVGGRFGSGTSRFVRANAAFLATRVARHPSALVQPGSAVAVGVGLRSLVRRRQGAERPDRVPDGSYGVLLLAVDPDHQRHGHGRALIEAAAASARGRGCQSLHLTLNPADEATTRFYLAMGWARLDPAGDTPRAWLMGKDLRS